MHRRLVAVCAAACLLTGVSPAVAASKAPDTWDGLARIDAKRFDAAYLLPGADFRSYTKVILDPTEVAFEKDWLRDHNRNATSISQRISEGDARKGLDLVRTGFEETFRKAYPEAGYQVVTEPGPDVLRVRTAVTNLYVAAPDQATSGRSRTYTREAGAATVIVEVRDSLSGAVLGRAVDARTTGDTGPYFRNSVSNRAAFMSLFQRWARISLDGLAELKARSPIPGPAETASK